MNEITYKQLDRLKKIAKWKGFGSDESISHELLLQFDYNDKLENITWMNGEYERFCDYFQKLESKKQSAREITKYNPNSLYTLHKDKVIKKGKEAGIEIPDIEMLEKREIINMINELEIKKYQSRMPFEYAQEESE